MGDKGPRTLEVYIPTINDDFEERGTIFKWEDKDKYKGEAVVNEHLQFKMKH